MKRTLSVALLGASLLVPMHVDGQRTRSRNAPTAREVVPANTGRLANCRAPRGGRAYVCRAPRTNVVYRYSGRIGNRGRLDIRGRRGWIAADWGRVRMRVGRRAVVNRGVINQGRLRDILGDRTVRRLRDHGRRAGLRGALRGHWQQSRAQGAVLEVTMGRQELAEFVDYDRDGFVDEVFVRNAGRFAYGW